MKNSPALPDQLLNQVFEYSKKQISFKRQLYRYFIIFGLTAFFGLLVYFSVAYLQFHFKSTIFYLLFIAGVISVSLLINWIQEKSELQKIKNQEKVYAKAFVLLRDKYQVATKNIKARDQFLSIISHELKTPLAIMLLKLNDMSDNIQKISLANFSVDKLMAVLKNSEQQISWLSLMINDLLDVSLITTGRMKLQLEQVDLVNLTDQVRQSFSEMLKKENYKIKISAESPVVGRWDKARIKQVVTNLLSNAIKYGKGNPIEIEIFKNGNKAKFVIQDEGIGIAAQEQKVIFDLFKRASANQEYKKGLGVGLFITAQIVKMHGGAIRVSSVPKKGTSFIVELPLNRMSVNVGNVRAK